MRGRPQKVGRASWEAPSVSGLDDLLIHYEQARNSCPPGPEVDAPQNLDEDVRQDDVACPLEVYAESESESAKQPLVASEANLHLSDSDSGSDDDSTSVSGPQYGELDPFDEAIVLWRSLQYSSQATDDLLTSVDLLITEVLEHGL